MLLVATGHNGHKPKRPQPKRTQTETATNRKGHKPERPQTELATNRNGHKPERPQTETATDRNGHGPERPQTEAATDRNGHKPKRPHQLSPLGRKYAPLKWVKIGRVMTWRRIDDRPVREAVMSSFTQCHGTQICAIEVGDWFR